VRSSNLRFLQLIEAGEKFLVLLRECLIQTSDGQVEARFGSYRDPFALKYISRLAVNHVQRCMRGFMKRDRGGKEKRSIGIATYTGRPVLQVIFSTCQ
jgi:hypothetical protein